MLKKLLLFTLIIAALAASSMYWSAYRKPAKPALPANVRQALGVKLTLMSIKRTSSNTVSVAVKLKNCRRDRRSVRVSSSFLVVGKPRWPILRQSETSSGMNPGECIITYECQIPSHIRSTLVACDVELERPHSPTVTSFNNVNPSLLPISKSINGIRTTLLWIRPNPRIISTSWDAVISDGNSQSGKNKCFGLLVQNKFRRGYFASTGCAEFKDEHGNAVDYTALYGKNVSGLRKIDAYGSKIDAMLDKTKFEKMVDKVSPIAGEQINDLRADRAEKVELKRPQRPETLLYVFPGNIIPKKFSYSIRVQQDDDLVGKTTIPFGNVPIH